MYEDGDVVRKVRDFGSSRRNKLKVIDSLGINISDLRSGMHLVNVGAIEPVRFGCDLGAIWLRLPGDGYG